MAHRLKHRIEYIALLLAFKLLGLLPHRIALGHAWLAAWISHRIFRFRADEARRRIRAVLGDGPSKREIERIAWISWRNLCFNVVEMARFPRINRRRMSKMVESFEERVELIESLLEENGGLILGTMHFGNWELGARAIQLAHLPIFVIARRQKNPLTDGLLLKTRGRAGMEVVLNDSRVMQNIIRRIRDGQIFAILPDVRTNTPALDIEFLGGRANIGGGMAMFARQTNLPIVPAYGTRKGWGKHSWTVLPAVYPDQNIDKREDWRRMTQQVMSQFSDAIIKNPEQYFWYNKRWVLDPLED